MRLILASASPRRLQLLRSVGLLPEVRPVDIDESPHPGEDPRSLVLRLARAKADRAATGAPLPGALILAADTTVAIDGQVLGKPRDTSDAARMLRLLSGREHRVLTALALRFSGTREDGADDVCESRVTFAPLADADIAAYVATGEPMDKAGAYGIQAGGGRFVERVEGSYSNVVGLPIESLEPLFTRLGVVMKALSREGEGNPR